MATARELITTALRRLRIVAAGETPAAEDAEHMLDVLNSMMSGWASQGVDVQHQTLTLDDPLRLFVPSAAVTAETLAALAYQATWNASTNSPSLASSTGTQGYLYRVATAGSTTLDDVTSWSAEDYAVFNGDVWLKGLSSSRFEAAVTDMLSASVVDDFGKPMTPRLQADAADAWRNLQAAYIRADAASFDPGLVQVPSRRYYGILAG